VCDHGDLTAKKDFAGSPAIAQDCRAGDILFADNLRKSSRKFPNNPAFPDKYWLTFRSVYTMETGS
jgi:hypothetical protein